MKVDLLLVDAFSTGIPADEFAAVDGSTFGGPSRSEVTEQRKFLASLLQRLDSFPDLGRHPPYWSERRASTASGEPLPFAAATRAFVRTVDALGAKGYFEEAFGKDCVDDPTTINESNVIEERVGHRDMWPLDATRLAANRDEFFDVVKVLHDLISRPRNGTYHSYSGCGWHYSDFSRDAGRRLYRWHVNRILERAGLELRLADTGEDEGRLVESTDDARADLVQLMAAPTDPSADEVRHAIAQFRSRSANQHDKRLAVVSLAGVLEARRALLKEKLFRGDEAALFEIANKFAIRHRGESQKADYDPIFLDWVFWWYLATIELTDRISTRSS